MVNSRVKISTVVESQLPNFVREEFPLVNEFFSEYYNSAESIGAPYDILQNIDQYLKVDNITNTVVSSTLTSYVEIFDRSIQVDSTSGFPETYGLIQIDEEVILYKTKTDTSFDGCSRGFSGVTSYQKVGTPEELVFSSTSSNSHESGSVVTNLSSILFAEFLNKIKKQFTPGFESRDLANDLNENIFIKQSKDFYQTKGTDRSFKILFKALYDKPVEVIKPRDFVFEPSNARYVITKDIVVEALEGDPLTLANKTLRQDESPYNSNAYGSIISVEKFSRQDKDYYLTKLDYEFNKDIDVAGSIFGTFNIHPKTYIINSDTIPSGSSIIEVESTAGFPNSGDLTLHIDVYDNNNIIDTIEQTVSYTGKTITQFLGCTNVPEILNSNVAYFRINDYAYGINDDGEQVKVRISGVLSDLEIKDSTYFFLPKEEITTVTLGKSSSKVSANSWVFNIPITYDISSSSIVYNLPPYTYRFDTYDEHSLSRFDKVSIKLSNGTVKTGRVTAVPSSKGIIMDSDSGIIDISLVSQITKKTSKVETTNYSEADGFKSNIEAVYIGEDDETYVASPSLPAYQEKISINDFSSVIVNNTYSSSQILTIGNNSYYTGDEVVYRKSSSSTIDIEEGVYFVYKVDERNIKLSRSRSDIFNNIFITFSGQPVGDKLEILNLSYQRLEPQNLIRRIASPINDSSTNITNPGEITGMFVNGVEVLNYKSNDFVYYGPLKEIDVISPGFNYDVTNPPILEISDSVGSGATATCSVFGSLTRVDIIDPGFDYISEPVISITGGNGKGAKVKANLSSVEHVVRFNSSSLSTNVDISNNTIGFATYHKFRDGEKVIYQTFGQRGITGLTTDALYHVSVIDSNTIKLYTTYDFAIAKGSNSINVGLGTTAADYGEGIHAFKAFDKKKIISSINVVNSGSGYENNQKTIDSGNTLSYNKVIPSSDLIRIKNHNYRSGETIVYQPLGGSPIGGLAAASSYIVTKIDDDNFKISSIGSTSIGQDFYYKTKQYVNLTSIGSSVHSFNYPQIQVSVNGILGFSTSVSEYQAIVNPVFRGEIYSVNLISSGSLYGSENIINFNRQPSFNTYSGSSATLIPIVSDGRIKEVLVNSPGYAYNSTPDLLIEGDGTGAILSPVIVDGAFERVVVVNPGYGYTKDKTSVTVVPAGEGAEFNAKITSWNINTFERLLKTKQVSPDDGVITGGINPSFGLQYTHVSPPRSLRQILQATSVGEDGQVIRRADIESDTDTTGAETFYHSPLIGWAYDGNPIYGPYGYSNSNGGQIARMQSSYELVLSSIRPSSSLFPQGFFVEDYTYNANHSATLDTYLDEHNGRYCSTPEFPNGTYAYFCTVNNQGLESDGSFKGQRLPIFPYIIGNSYKSKPDSFNYSIYSNQNDIDINSTKWNRNTKIYNFFNKNTHFDYLINPILTNRINAEVKSTTKGRIESVKVLSSGNNYKIGDEIIFDNTNTGGSNSIVKVSQLVGKTITSVSCASSTISGVEFIPYGEVGSFVAFSTNPHNIANDSTVRITGISTNGTSIEGSYSANVKRSVFSLKSGIGTVGVTGIVTTIGISGNLTYPYIKENDIFKIADEQIKVINVYEGTSQIRILREQNGTTGAAHSTFEELLELPRKLYFNIGFKTSYDYKINKEYYFDPEKTVGIGTTSGVGITSTLTLDSNRFNSAVGIGTSSETRLYFNNINDLTLYSSGGYITILNTTTPTGVSSDVFHVSHAKITSVGSTSIDIDFDSSLLYGIGVTAYVDKKQTLDIPTKTLYIPNHGLKTGTKIAYSPKVGTAISISVDGTTDFKSLSDFSDLYTIKITDDLIGISSVRVGFSSEGSIVGLGTTSNDSTLYFIGIGTGTYHSITSIYSDVITGEIISNEVTVSTASTHGLIFGDKVDINLVSTATTSVTIQYNQENRRMVVNPISFDSSDVDSDLNLIQIENHGFKNGDKVIYTATTAIGGLVNNGIYYIVAQSPNKVQLASSHYSATKTIPDVINFTSEETGTLSLVNPGLKVYKNQQVDFILSSSTLAFGSIPSFKLEFYKDSKFTDIYKSDEFDGLFEVSRTGTVGVDPTAKVSLKITSNTQKTLYYRLEPINLLNNPTQNKEIIVDDEIIGNNSISVLPSAYNGTQTISGITTNTFKFNLSDRPEKLSYENGTNCNVTYYTHSQNTSGGIYKFDVFNGGYGYKSPPGITTISSLNGFGAIVVPESTSIGSIKNVRIKDIAYDYPSDKTVRPTANLPQILKVSALSQFSRIGISSAGRNYTKAPTLVVVDGLTLKQVKDTDIKYNLGDSVVTILKNTDGISEVNPTIIPTNNPNGVKISNIVYNVSSGIATATLSVAYSDIRDFPFAVGDKVIIEYSNILPGSGSGFNSSDYEYALFPIVSTDPNIGGENGTISYDMSSVLESSESAGTFDPINSICYATPDSFFPKFDISLTRKDFYNKESVGTNNYSGTVEFWDGKTGYLKVASYQDFLVGDLITGQSSKTKARINTVYKFNSQYNVDSTNIFTEGFYKETGFLNNNLQRLHDNDYYQYFSYSLKSTVPLNDWDEPVQSLNHASGFKKFSDLSIESEADWVDNKGPDDTFVGIKTDQNGGTVDAINDISSITDLNCVSDFDLASETSLVFGGIPLSERIIFNSKIIQDYSESVTNRVLLLDDVSSQFDDKVRTYGYSIADSYDVDSYFTRKYFAYVKDKRFNYVRQSSFVTIVHNGSVGFVNQYGKVYTSYDIGNFDVSVTGDSVNFEFWPINYRFNDYDINLISYVPNQTSFSLGDTVNVVGIATTTFSSGSSTNIVSIATSYRSSKLSVQVESSGKYQFDELSLLHDGTNVYMTEYGTVYTSTGLGTYSASISGSNVVLTFNSNSGVAGTIRALRVSIGDTTSSGVGSTSLVNSNFEAFITEIPSSSGISTIARYNQNLLEDEYAAAYYIVSVEDLTNNRYQLSEVLVLDDQTTPHIVEYGTVVSSVGLGTIGIGTTNSTTELYFTPISGIDAEVRVYQNSIGVANETKHILSISDSVISSSSEYVGTDNINTKFELTYNDIPVFVKEFDGSSSSIVSTANSTVTIPNHYFVTGEEIEYKLIPDSGESPIGIATTTIAGIGITDILPSSVYAIKLDDKTIQLAATAEDALSDIPTYLLLNSVGIGTRHRFISKNQNGKSLISIDNAIQNPIFDTDIKTVTNTAMGLYDDVVDFVGVSSFKSGDFIKIDSEIMKVISVGYGSTYTVLLNRYKLGTELSPHSIGSTVTKIEGNYNIEENSIYFTESPYGEYPVGYSTADPDNRDYSGITTHSSFSGRIFLRSGEPGGTRKAYYDNYIFDDLTPQFNGITTSFTLKSLGSDAVGVQTNNPIVLVDGIFQNIQRIDTAVQVVGNYDVNENAGISTLTFLGSVGIKTSDLNTSRIPVGGVIYGVGSTEGFGYQSLVSAGATVQVSAGGTIESISIGNSGSGYRSGIQTVVNVYGRNSIEGSSIQSIGTAAVSGGNIVSIAITNPGIGYTSYPTLKSSFISYPVSSGSTIIYSYDLSGISTGNFVSVGAALTNVYVVGIGSTSFTIGAGDTTSESIGVGTAITFKRNDSPIVIIDSPLAYSNIPLVYSSDSTGPGIGSGATIDIFVGSGSSVTNFTIKNRGYAYKQGEILTVDITDAVGIPTDISKAFREFQIFVDQTFENKFSAWSVGELQLIDDISPQFNGVRKSFTLAVDGNITSITARKGSNIDIKSNLLVFLNDVLQTPGDGYIFNGGSVITFPEAPNGADSTNSFGGDTCKILYYRGTKDIDVIDVDILETVKVGDELTLMGDDPLYTEDERLVTLVDSSTSVLTNPYAGPGINTDSNYLRPVKWCRQTEDKIINGKPVGKDRVIYEALINPVSNIIRSVGVNTNAIFVTSIKPFFDDERENLGSKLLGKIEIYNPIDTTVSASATAIVSAAGTITSISIGNSGFGYDSAPTVIIGEPYGLGTTQRATATSSITSGIVTSITVVNPGIGYTLGPIVNVSISSTYFGKGFPSIGTDTFRQVRLSTITGSGRGATGNIAVINDKAVSVSIAYSGSGYKTGDLLRVEYIEGVRLSNRIDLTVSGVREPLVFVAPPSLSDKEIIEKVTYEGDFGIIAGVGTTTVGVAVTGLTFDFFIPLDSPLRDENINVGVGTTGVSGIQTGYYFIVNNSNIGSGITSYDLDGNVVGFGTTCLDNIYQAVDVQYVEDSNAIGVGTTSLIRVTVSVNDYDFVGIGTSAFFGEFSWGKINTTVRKDPKTFTASTSTGVTGFNTCPIVRRFNPLKYEQYTL